MACDRELQLMISCYADGEATPAQAARVEEHLASCAACRKLLDDWQGQQQLFTWAYTRAIPEEINAEISAEAVARQLIQEEHLPMIDAITVRKPVHRLFDRRTWARVGALAAIVLLAVMLYQLVAALSFLGVGRSVATGLHPRATRMNWDVDLNVGPYSKIRRLDAHAIRLEQGWVLATIRHGSHIDIETPRMKVTDRGTCFYTGTGAKSDYVIVEAGAVDVAAGNTSQTVNAGTALFTAEQGNPVLFSQRAAQPATEPKEHSGQLLAEYAPHFIPCSAEDLALAEGIRRLATRFPQLRTRGGGDGTSQREDGGKGIDYAINMLNVTGVREGLPAHYLQIAQLLAGAHVDLGDWEIPVALMQCIGVTNPRIADDVYVVQLALKGGSLYWRFSGSIGGKVDVPVTFKEGQGNYNWSSALIYPLISLGET